MIQPIKVISFLLLIQYCATSYGQHSYAPFSELEKNRYPYGLTEGNDSKPADDHIRIDNVILSNTFLEESNPRLEPDSLIRPLYKFEHLFVHDPQMSHEFNQYNSYRKKQITGNIIGITIITGSIVGGFAIANNGTGSTPGRIGGANVIVIGGGLGFFYTLLNNLSNGRKKSKHKTALLSMIDAHQLGFEKPPSKIELVITQDGLGLICRF